MSDRPSQAETATPEPVYRRRSDVSVTQVDEELFLVPPKAGGRGIFHLDPVGAGVWRLFAEPHSLQQAQAVVRAAFPQVDRERIDADVARLVERLLAAGLLVADPPARDRSGP